MPTHEWTLADDRPGGGGPRNFRTALIVVAVLSVAVAVLVALRLLGPGSSEEGVPKLGHKTYEAQVDCRVNSSGDSGTVTIDGTIRGESSRFEVTVEVLDTATKQRLALQTFEVSGTTTFGGTTPAQAPVGSAGIECRITEVR
ncbi:hypothetical protein BJF79_32285 [Actinomadura sp. CNU-125]|uniref:hypothetical protein n=1 Tax=Actinomadura sp. CNU-125 TaxID=1904961 RepID=UPI00095CF8D3|nr:hypothetical protein [Actinomadura sp. CNU-125]OLT35571.1 hypothetical protein BJF79_32285 [Actinomadura sp. CNU-125]